MRLRKWLRLRYCTQIQLKKEKVMAKYGDGFLYKLLCKLDWIIDGGKWWMGIVEIKHRNAAGEIVKREFCYNAHLMVNGGEQAMLDLFLAALNTPAGFQIAAFDDTLAATDTLADLQGEPSGNGYARPTLARNDTDWPIGALDGGHWKRTSKTFTIGASGGSVGPVSLICMATTDATPRLISGIDITSKTWASGESSDFTYGVKLKLPVAD